MSSLLTNVIRRQDVHLLALRSRDPACRARDGGAVRRQWRAADRVLGARARGEHALGGALREFFFLTLLGFSSNDLRMITPDKLAIV